MIAVVAQPISASPLVAEPRHFFRLVDGVNLHWVEFGVEFGERAGRPPVVLLHGLNDSHLTWRQIAPLLSPTRRVLALDLPGHGLSDRPDASYELAWYAQIVAHWIESLGLGKRMPTAGRIAASHPHVLRLPAFRGRIKHGDQ